MRFYEENPPVLLSDTPEQKAIEMEQLYPGIKFLPYAPEKKVIRLASKLEMPTLTYPLAIMQYEEIEPVAGHAQQMLDAFEKLWIPTFGEVSFTTLKYATGFSFETVIGTCLDCYLNQDVWLLSRFGLHRWLDEKFYYTTVRMLVRRSEKDDPKWLTEIYRG